MLLTGFIFRRSLGLWLSSSSMYKNGGRLKHRLVGSLSTISDLVRPDGAQEIAFLGSPSYCFC